MPLPLYLLAVAVFAMGTSEFMLAGLAPDIAIDLDVSVGVAGLLTSAFAVGMVIGAPLMAALARRWLSTWRATFWAIALLCLPAAFGIVKGITGHAGKTTQHTPAGSSLRDEIAQLAMPRLVLVMLLAALINAATFATFTFLAPIVTDTAGLGELWVSVVLVLFGVGSFVGVTLPGRLSDQRPPAWVSSLLVALALLIALPLLRVIAPRVGQATR